MAAVLLIAGGIALVPGRTDLLAAAQGALGEGEAGRRDPLPTSQYAVRVVLPSFGAWVAKLGVIAVFLAAYSIPVTFHTVMTVAGGNSLANTVSATPGGVGINQAINTASLKDVTDPATAAAYSTGQQLIVTAWNVLLAIVLVVWAFGWTGGKTLVAGSYDEAKTKLAEQKAERAARRKPSARRRTTGAACSRACAGSGRTTGLEHERRRSVMVVANTFWENFFLLLIFLPLAMIWVFALMDIFRRDDIGGGWKAVWVACVILVPFFGTLAYLIVRPAGVTEDERMLRAAARREFAAQSPADGTSQLQAPRTCTTAAS